MGGMFEGCYNLETIDVSNFDTSNVNNINNMFSFCFNLEFVNLSNFDTRNNGGDEYAIFSLHKFKKVLIFLILIQKMCFIFKKYLLNVLIWNI